MNTRLLLTIVLSLCGFCTSGLIEPKDPPKPWLAALMARYIIHATDWVSIATISTQSTIKGYPFVGLKSMSDGPISHSTGVPYLYMSSMDVTGHDLESNSNVTIMATLAQTDFCRSKDFDPQDPRCAKVLMTGKFVKIKNPSPEYQFGQSCLFARHPAMENWPTNHGFYVSKIDPIQIDVLDYFGGLKHVSIKDYFDTNMTKLINKADSWFESVSVIQVEA